MIALDPWFALEAAIAQWDRQEAARQYLASLELGEDAVPPGVTYGRHLVGGCLEPGYREQRQTEFTECQECGRWRCQRDDYERAEGGSLNFYYRLSCDACDFYDTNDDW